MQYLVLGANGYVGGYLYKRMREDGLNVIGTKRCQEEKNDLIFFDILNDSISNIIKLMTDKERTVIFCIAQANLDQCMVEYDLSRKINVISVKNVIKKLILEKFHVIYFSSDNVFDGLKGNYTELDKTHAINQYGKMKEETEQYLLSQYPEVCIFRMPRVIGMEKEKKNLLTDLEEKIPYKQVRCIRNNKMSVIAKEDIYQACLIASEKKMCGLYNLSNGEIYDRKELAAKFFDIMGIYDVNIVELDLEEFGFKDIRPLDVGLDNSKFRQETGYEFTSYDMLIKQYMKNK